MPRSGEVLVLSQPLSDVSISFREYFRKSRKNVLKVGKSRNFWSKVAHFPKSRKNDSKVGKSRKSRTPLTA